MVGIGAAAGSGGPMRLDTALGCVAVALLLQVVANFANDLSDFRRGADTPDRQGPLRVAAAGLVTERQLEIAIGFTIGLAGVVGLWLAYVGGPVLILLGVLAVVAALAYTGGPWPYGYRGLGEVFVFVFFGLVAVVGTAYLQTGRLEALYWAAAIPAGALITAILVVNNLRDIPTDTAAGKRTLAVMLGERGAQAEYAVLLGGGVPRAGGPGVRRAVVARAARRCCRCRWRSRCSGRSVGSATGGSSTSCSRGPRGWRWCSRCCSRPGWRRRDRGPDHRVASRRPGCRAVPPAVPRGRRDVERARGLDPAADRRRRPDGRRRGGGRAR